MESEAISSTSRWGATAASYDGPQKPNRSAVVQNLGTWCGKGREIPARPCGFPTQLESAPGQQASSGCKCLQTRKNEEPAGGA